MLDKINIDFLSVYFLRFILSLSLSLAGCCPFVCAQMFAFVWPSRCNAEKGKSNNNKKEKREERIRQQQQPEKSKIIRSNKIESETNEWTADSFVFMRACNGRNMYDDD